MMAQVEVHIPTCTLEIIQRWAKKSGLGQARFYTIALSMGVGVMESSLGYLDDLTPEALGEAALEMGDDEMLAELEADGERLSQELLAHSRRGAAQSVTPADLAQIVLGEGAKAESLDLRLVTLAVEFPDERAKGVEVLAEKSGMGNEHFYAMAFAMGARTIAHTLSPFSFFSPKAVARAIGKPIRQPGKPNQRDS